MTFEEILDQAIAMLQRRGRLTSRTLQRQFQLDDAALEDLKDELIYGQRLAADEEGRVLVWTGGTDMASATAPRAPAAQETSRAQVEASPPVPPPPAAERRQLTVMFCDLVDSTALSGQLDPEDLREVIRAYQQTSAGIIQQFEGSIAQYLGDGLLVYFGYPQAHEDDAQRAVRAGLGILEATEGLNCRLAQQYRVRVAVRIGIHTGLVVVGEMGGGERQEHLALGETPNIAARLQGLAPPNRVVISHRTRQLVGGTFDLDELGTHALKGVAASLPVYGVRMESAAEGRFAAATATGLTPLVGRETEFRLLLERWDHAQAGKGQVVLLAGEAGIGKSRLTATFHERMAAAPHIRLHYQCAPYTTNSAFAPIIGQLKRAARLAWDDPPDQKLAKLEGLLAQATAQVTEVAPLFAALLSIPTGDRYPPLPLTPQRHKAKTIAALVDQVCGLARHQPVVCLWEDAHWSDPTSLEVLDQVVHRVPDQRVLVVITYRPEFTPPWTAAAHVTAVTLTRLSRTHVVTMIERLTGGKGLPQEVLDQLLAKTDGVPLFVEELTKTVLESGLLREQATHYALTGPLAPLAIPATLHDALMARLDRLTTIKAVAQLGATIGRTFAYALLQAVAPWDEATLQQGLRQLVAAELVSQQGVPPQATYTFKHALIQDAAYHSILRSTRAQFHQRIAQAVEVQFPETAATQPELVAHHYTEAGLTAQAILYWQRAGHQASNRSAYLEAISHVTTGITLLTTLPETPERTQHAVTLYIALGAALQVTKGHTAPEVEQAFTQAYTLCQQVGETPALVSVLFGLSRFYVAQGQLHTAREIGETLLRLAQRTDNATLPVIAHYVLGMTWSCLGALPTARQHLEEAIAHYTPDQRRAPEFRMGYDPVIGCRGFAAQTLWVLGYPEQALAHLYEALALAQELSHPFSLAYARRHVAVVSQLRRDVPAVREQAEAAITLATEQGFPLWVAVGTLCRGWALAMQSQDEQGLVQVREGMAAWQATGAALLVPYFGALLADVCDHLGHPEDGLQALTEADALMAQHEERWWEAEVKRLRGVLLLRQTMPPQEEAETCFHQALAIARQQRAKSLELRAAMSLARLWQQQGKRNDARTLLAPIYDWFTEGFDTADLQEAKALLAALM
jgi:class 3 adenylate cyclase/predicted ATPase